MLSLTLKHKLLFISFILFIFALYPSFVIIYEIINKKKKFFDIKSHINTIKHFDPKLVDLFLKSKDELISIRNTLRDL